MSARMFGSAAEHKTNQYSRKYLSVQDALVMLDGATHGTCLVPYPP
jgi:hypothetical protein